MSNALDAIAWLTARFVADVIIDGRHVATFRGWSARRRAADFALGWAERGIVDQQRAREMAQMRSEMEQRHRQLLATNGGTE